MARALQGLRAAPAFLWRIPFRLCLLVTLLLHVIGEEYPFSNFPMYSNFHNDTRVIWIGDQNGQPLATHYFFGRRVSSIKKILDTRILELKRQADSRGEPVLSDDELAPAAATTVLEELWNRRREGRLEDAGITELRFMEQDIWFADNRLHETEQHLASKALPNPEPAGN
jgi:hypothetical protein